MAKEIEHYVTQLPSTPGWVALTQSDREWMQEHTSKAVVSFRDTGLRAIQFCAELASIQNFLEGKSMSFKNWLNTCFGPSARTGYRWLASYKKMLAVAHGPALMYLAEEGLAGVNNTLAPNALLPVLKALPAPKGADRKLLEPWREKVSAEVRQRLSKRRKRIPLKLGEEDAMREWIITGRRLIRDAGLDTSAAQRAWLKRSVGYLMEIRAISGSITIERTPVPDGFMPQVGRPRLKAE